MRKECALVGTRRTVRITSTMTVLTGWTNHTLAVRYSLITCCNIYIRYIEGMSIYARTSRSSFFERFSREVLCSNPGPTDHFIAVITLLGNCHAVLRPAIGRSDEWAMLTR